MIGAREGCKLGSLSLLPRLKLLSCISDTETTSEKNNELFLRPKKSKDFQGPKTHAHIRYLILEKMISVPRHDSIFFTFLVCFLPLGSIRTVAFQF